MANILFNARHGLSVGTTPPIQVVDDAGAVSATTLKASGALFDTDIKATPDTGQKGLSGVRLRNGVANAATNLSLMPNGSSTYSSLRLYNKDDATGVNMGGVQLDVSGTAVSLNGVSSGTGSAPTSLSIGLTTTMTAGLNVTGSVAISGGDLTVSGNLYVNGDTVTMNTAVLEIEDKNIELGKVATPLNETANGGGITLLAGVDGNKTLIWDSINFNWTSSEHFNIATGKSYKIANVNVLNQTTLGSSVLSSTLTGVGVLTTGSIADGFGHINIGVNGVTAGSYNISSNTVLNQTTLGSTVLLSSLTKVGALTLGSIGNGFGNINIGANTVTANSFVGTLTGVASNVSDIVAIPNGGTGASSAGAALTNILPAGTVNGYVLKTSGPGSYFWAAETGGSPATGTTISSTRLSYVATAGQTIFTAPSYVVGASQLRIYIDGVRQFPSEYTETNATTVTMGAPGVTLGSVVLIEVDGYVSNIVTAASVTNTATGLVPAGNVQGAIADLESRKAPIASPTFTGTVAGVTATMVGLGNVTNESKATMFSDPTFTGASITVGNTTSSSINMVDTDEGNRTIHCNSNQIGFLNQTGGWGAYCDDNGNWYANNISGSCSGTNTGDQTNISGNAATAGTSTYSTYLWATSHVGTYYISNYWTGTYWRIISNHGSGVSVAHADYAATAGSAPANGGTSAACSGNAENITTPTGGYKHVGAWGVGRTAVGAILVNTAYTADYASYATSAGSAPANGGTSAACSGNAASASSLTSLPENSIGAVAKVTNYNYGLTIGAGTNVPGSYFNLPGTWKVLGGWVNTTFRGYINTNYYAGTGLAQRVA